jgi:hypothetical protein
MDVRIRGSAPPGPFLSARDLFETEHGLECPVEVRIREDPDERTWTGHTEDEHVLNISEQAARSAMARPLALHEYAHMARYEEGHPSHHQSTREALYLALAGQSVERRRLAQCYQIANHMKDIYADDITLDVAPADRLVRFLESSLATAVADRPGSPAVATDGGKRANAGTAQGPPASGGFRQSATSDPEMTAVNAAFALALVERHDLVDAEHRLYDLAHAATDDAPSIDLAAFTDHFRDLPGDTDESAYRQALVDVTGAFVDATAALGAGPQAAD